MDSAASESSAKRRKIWDPSTFVHNQAPVKLQLTKGDKTQTWYLQKKLLVQKSTKFRNLLSATDTVSLDSSTEEETIERFSVWISSGNLVFPVPKYGSTEPATDEETDNNNEGIINESLSNASSTITAIKSEDSSEGIALSSTEINKPWFVNLVGVNQRFYGRLLDLYLFVNKYEVPTLKTEVLIRWQRHTTSCGEHVCMDILDRALLALPLGDGLIRYQVADFGFHLAFGHYTGLDYHCLPAPFLAQLLEFVQRACIPGNFEAVDPVHDWCQFHDHTESERTECHRRRPNDPDVR